MSSLPAPHPLERNVGPGVPGGLEVLGGDVQVPVSSGFKLPYANMDYAASAPCLRVVADAVGSLLPYYASVHRGAGALSQLCTRRYEEARDSVAMFVGARADDHVVFTRNTTDALNLLARTLPADTTVVTFAGEHHANLLPWSRVVRLTAPASPAEAVGAAHTTLAELRASTSAPLVLTVTGASNVTGEIWPVEELAAVAHRHRARLVVDAAQLAPHRRIDLTASDIDYVAFSGHKLYAPFGTGVLVGRADWLDAAGPYLAGGGATSHVGDVPGDVCWATGPARHEGGSPNVLGAVALATACDALAAADRTAVEAAEGALATRLHDGLAAVPGVRTLGAPGPWSARVGIVSFAVDGLDARGVSAGLAAEFGVGVRDGLFCAHPFTRGLLAGAGASATTAVRASLGLGSTAEHVERLIEGVAAIAGRTTGA